MKHSEKKFKTLNIKGKEYVEVNQRIKYLAFEFDGEYSIETEYDYFPERKMWVVKARLTMHQDGITEVYTGLAQEVESDNWKDVNHTSALENCETSAVGRACAMAGIGIDTSIASADEIHKAINRQERTKSNDPQPKAEKPKPTPPPEPKQEQPTLATVKQKTELLLLVNNKHITNEEKNKMIEGINKLTSERATQAISKLKKTIEVREEKAKESGNQDTAMATEKQIELIQKLTKSHVFENDATVRKLHGLIATNSLTLKRATEAIEWIKSELETRKSSEKEEEKIKALESKIKALQNHEMYDDQIGFTIDDQIKVGGRSVGNLETIVGWAEHELAHRQKKYDHANH